MPLNLDAFRNVANTAWVTSRPDPEPLGRFKAFFLVTADRDAVGRRGQNKGFVNGKFFAIDPGHSLEGNGT